MTRVKHSLSRDDWDLTLKQLRSQLTSAKLQIGVVEAGIKECERMIRRLPADVTEGVLE